MLSADLVKNLVKDNSAHTIKIRPVPQLSQNQENQAAIDLRLGRWFLTFRQDKNSQFDLTERDKPNPRRHFVKFGEQFILHPRRFVLAATLEWLQFGENFGGYVMGKSRLGRKGLIIETAAGIHPGFQGCLTLELANVGEVPLAVRPGMEICQLFVHRVDGSKGRTSSLGASKRGPTA